MVFRRRRRRRREGRKKNEDRGQQANIWRNNVYEQYGKGNYSHLPIHHITIYPKEAQPTCVCRKKDRRGKRRIMENVVGLFTMCARRRICRRKKLCFVCDVMKGVPSPIKTNQKKVFLSWKQKEDGIVFFLLNEIIFQLAVNAYKLLVVCGIFNSSTWNLSTSSFSISIDDDIAFYASQ